MGGTVTGAGWHVDPTGRFTYRYYDGTRWTGHVIRDGVPATDAVDPPGGPGVEDHVSGSREA